MEPKTSLLWPPLLGLKPVTTDDPFSLPQTGGGARSLQVERKTPQDTSHVGPGTPVDLADWSKLLIDRC